MYVCIHLCVIVEYFHSSAKKKVLSIFILQEAPHKKDPQRTHAHTHACHILFVPMDILWQNDFNVFHIAFKKWATNDLPLVAYASL